MNRPLPPAHSPRRPWQRFVAIGDSFTEGMCDPSGTDPDEFRGWADRLAEHLAGVAALEGRHLQYANLAVRGRLLDDITRRQLPAALALKPDLVSIVGGGNDILRARADIDALASQLENAVIAIRSTGADVLLATPTDPAGAPVIRHLRGRHSTFTAFVWTIARRHGCAVIDQWGLEALKDWSMWAPDRIHMTAEGHRRVALAAFAALGYDPQDADFSVRPPEQPVSLVERLRGDGQWARVHAAPWLHRRLVGRSSGDNREPKRPQPLPLGSPDA